MKLEKFRTFDGVQIRAADKKGMVLFEHCAGGSCVPLCDESKLHELLYTHGVVGIHTVNHHSIVEMGESE